MLSLTRGVHTQDSLAQLSIRLIATLRMTFDQNFEIFPVYPPAASEFASQRGNFEEAFPN